MTAEREQTFRALRELAEACPDMRLGQLIVNLSYLARGMAHESIWDMEDDELLRAAQKQLEELRARHIVAAK